MEIFNQQSPQPLWDVSPDLSNTTEYPSAQPTMEVPSDRRLTEAGLQDLNASQNSCGHHTLASVSPRLVPTVSGDMADSPLLAHAAKTPQQLSYPQTSAAPHTLLSDSCTHGSRYCTAIPVMANLELKTVFSFESLQSVLGGPCIDTIACCRVVCLTQVQLKQPLVLFS